MKKNVPYQYKLSDSYNMSLHTTSFGKSVRNEAGTWYFLKSSFYTLHYVISGKGTLTKNGNTFELEAGNIVIIYPEDTCHLVTTDSPYINIWINFQGIDVANILSYTDITKNTPVFCASESLQKIFHKIDLKQEPGPHRQAHMLSILYEIFSKIIKDSVKLTSGNYKSNYISSFVKYVEENFNQNIQIGDIADYTGLSTSQLYRVVSEHFGMSPIKFLIKYRINKSKMLLKEKELKINVISNMCGFSDPKYFSKVFFKYEKMTPKEYREKY